MTRNTELIVALDVSTAEEALAMREELDAVVDFFKVGKELFTAAGPAILESLSPARVFLDLKFHDIPNTVAGAVTAASRYGVEILDVHASGGRAMMEAAVKAARASSLPKPPLVFGVTVLTHLDDEELEALGFREGSREQVVRLARLAAVSGLDGVVSSPLEIEPIRKACGDELRILVPGVRPDWASESHDQKRVATPREAARAGASHLVIGRAITRAPSPRDAAKRILDELARS